MNTMYELCKAERVSDCLQSWVETFNDCACCPLFGKCECEGDIESYDCADRILEWIKE